MSNQTIVPDNIRLLAEQAGLTKALTLFPDGVKSSIERGTRPVGDHKGVTPTSSPASLFDPTRFEVRS